MNYLENNPIKEFVKGKIIDKLEDLKGFEEQHYMCVDTQDTSLPRWAERKANYRAYDMVSFLQNV